jgi:hypothetical protein
MDILNIYKYRIKEYYSNLISSGCEITNNNLNKIFEYYCCIQLSEIYNEIFYEYNDIDPNFKEENKMSKTDTGIDACNLVDKIVQCKLRNKSLGWEECGTFFGSQITYDSVLKRKIIRWPNLIIARNEECKLSKHLMERQEL